MEIGSSSEPGRGKIDGKVSGVEMHFIKRMPVHYVFHLVQNRMMTLQEQMRLDEGIELDEPVPHPLLRYTGVYNAVADVPTPIELTLSTFSSRQGK